MSKTAPFERAIDAAPANDAVRPQRIDDKAMLKAAANLTRDLNVARPTIYWADMLGSALLGYGALAATLMAESLPVALVAGVAAILALYRAGSFIHEITHIKPNAVPASIGRGTRWSACRCWSRRSCMKASTTSTTPRPITGRRRTPNICRWR